MHEPGRAPAGPPRLRRHRTVFAYHACCPRRHAADRSARRPSRGWLPCSRRLQCAQRMLTWGAPQHERLIAASPNSLAALSGRSGVRPASLFVGSWLQEEPRSCPRALSPCAVHANLLLKIFGRARVGLAPASSAVVMGEVGCVPLGRWQRTRRIAHASDECAIEERARIVFRICNAFEHGRNVEPTTVPTGRRAARRPVVRLGLAVKLKSLTLQYSCAGYPLYTSRAYTPITLLVRVRESR